MIKNKQIYEKKTNEVESKYNATFIDFIQNIIAIRKLNIGEFCNKKITENSNKYRWITIFAILYVSIRKTISDLNSLCFIFLY